MLLEAVICRVVGLAHYMHFAVEVCLEFKDFKRRLAF